MISVYKNPYVETSNFFKRLKLNTWFYPLIPLLLWAVFALLPFLIPSGKKFYDRHEGFIQGIFYRNLLILVVFYLHAYLILPVLKFHSGKIKYFLCLLVAFVAFTFLLEYLMPKPRYFPLHEKTTDVYKSKPEGPEMRPMPAGRFTPFYFCFPLFTAAVLCSYCYCLLLSFNKREMALSERENANLKTELDFLRSQISPHFMFNVLNSMVSLTRKKSNLLEHSLINMSNLMRYMLYERNGNLIFLKTEVEYLHNYIDLQLLRYGDAVKLNMYISGNFESYQIEPMLLIPFVENAFKHGISMLEEPLIDIFLTVNSGNGTLQFIVLNNISPVKDMQEGGTGIGLQNIKRRMELLYPGRYELHVSNRHDIFKADLLIKMI